jgi:hypothetical protein
MTSPSISNSNATTATSIFATADYFFVVLCLVSWWFFLVPNEHLPSALTNLKPYSMPFWDIIIRLNCNRKLYLGPGVKQHFYLFNKILWYHKTRQTYVGYDHKWGGGLEAAPFLPAQPSRLWNRKILG